MRPRDIQSVRGITIILAAADPERFRTALVLALSQAALGGRARIFLQERSVALLNGDDAADYAAAGLPGRATMLADALDAGVEIIGCQSGLALVNAAAGDFDPRISWGGMVGLLQSLADDRLVIV